MYYFPNPSNRRLWSQTVRVDYCSTNRIYTGRVFWRVWDSIYDYTYLLLPTQSRALNKTGKPIFFNACEWGVEDPWEWMAEYANSWRSGPDHHDNWESTSKIIEVNADKAKYAGE